MGGVGGVDGSKAGPHHVSRPHPVPPTTTICVCVPQHKRRAHSTRHAHTHAPVPAPPQTSRRTRSSSPSASPACGPLRTHRQGGQAGLVQVDRGRVGRLEWHKGACQPGQAGRNGREPQWQHQQPNQTPTNPKAPHPVYLALGNGPQARPALLQPTHQTHPLLPYPACTWPGPAPQVPPPLHPPPPASSPGC